MFKLDRNSIGTQNPDAIVKHIYGSSNFTVTMDGTYIINIHVRIQCRNNTLFSKFSVGPTESLLQYIRDHTHIAVTITLSKEGRG